MSNGIQFDFFKNKSLQSTKLKSIMMNKAVIHLEFTYGKKERNLQY